MAWDAARVEAEFAAFFGGVAPDDARARKRLRILEAATELFVSQGYRKTSVDEVARAAGVSKGTVYLYFKGKTDLLVFAIGLEKWRHKDVLAAVFDPALSPRQRLRRYLETAFELIGLMPLTARIARRDPDLRHALDEIEPLLRERAERGRAEMMDLFLRPFAEEQGWTEQDLEDRGRALLGLLYAASAVMEAPGGNELEPHHHAVVLADMLVAGLAPGSDP